MWCMRHSRSAPLRQDTPGGTPLGRQAPVFPCRYRYRVLGSHLTGREDGLVDFFFMELPTVFLKAPKTV